MARAHTRNNIQYYIKYLISTLSDTHIHDKCLICSCAQKAHSYGYQRVRTKKKSFIWISVRAHTKGTFTKFIIHTPERCSPYCTKIHMVKNLICERDTAPIIRNVVCFLAKNAIVKHGKYIYSTHVLCINKNNRSLTYVLCIKEY